eukprot:Clim_evm112s152 gene=Clim_evmTU112s152
MADDAILIQKEDYSKQCDEDLPKFEQQAANGDAQGALDALLSFEKKCRNGGDTHSVSRVMLSVVKVAYQSGGLTKVADYVTLLTKKRGQIKQSVSKMMDEAVRLVDEAKTEEDRMKYIESLRSITEGKIHVEIQYAHLTKFLSRMYEAKGDMPKAADILQEAQVETLGSMDRKEKAEFILDQMRLCLANADVIRAGIIAKKITKGFFEKEDYEDLRITYYNYMIELALHDEKYLEACQYFRSIFLTNKIYESENDWQLPLKMTVFYLILTPRRVLLDNDQLDLYHLVRAEKKLDDLETFSKLLNIFMKKDIILWDDFMSGYGEDLAKLNVPNAEKRMEVLQRRLREHNIIILAEYYQRIRLKRAALLLQMDELACEKLIADCVVDKTIWARIDRPAGVVNFVKAKNPDEALEEWSERVKELMRLLNKTTHLIRKEEMVNEAMA